MDLSGTRIGTVAYINDPTHTGRCKIRVFGVLDDLSDEQLPWFSPANSSVFGTNGAGSIDVPKVGSIVNVKFENNDIYRGTYYGCEMADPSMINEIKDDYEDAHVLLYDADEHLMIIYQKMLGLKIFHNNSFINIDPTNTIQINQDNSAIIELKDGQIYITTNPGSGNNAGTGTVNISSANAVNIVSNSTVKVTADNIILGKSGGRHLVCAEDLANVLHEFAIAIDAKLPAGQELTAKEYNNIQAPGLSCD